MFKFVSLALGFLTVMTIAPSSRSTMVPTHRNQPSINGNLHAEKLVTIKRSTILRTSIKKTFNDQKVELSASDKESQRIRTSCPGGFNNSNRFGSNERPVGFPDSTSNNNAGNFNNANRVGDCSFSRQGSW